MALFSCRTCPNAVVPVNKKSDFKRSDIKGPFNLLYVGQLCSHLGIKVNFCKPSLFARCPFLNDQVIGPAGSYCPNRVDNWPPSEFLSKCMVKTHDAWLRLIVASF